MRFTVKCVCFGIYQVIDRERLETDTKQPRVVSTWRTMAGAAADARFRNEHGSE